MSVLIKGMEMPSSCSDCAFGHWSNLYQAVFCGLLNFKDYPVDYIGYKVKRLDKCPLVDVPVPHGRLIDADETKRLWSGCHIEGSIGPLLDTRPTVIEAEEKDED